ncbi:MAG TPA: M48 family metallopeptidase [Stellaceae bacterium]|nr:M48 family metallopeptidase [Stellaceae bacterium]
MSARLSPRAAALLAALALAGCSTVGAAVDTVTGAGSHVPDKGKMIDSLGQKPEQVPPTAAIGPDSTYALARSHLISGAGFMHVPELEAYVGDVMRRLQAQLPTPSPPVRVFLSPIRSFEAEGCAEGGIVITLGTLSALRSSDELAFILAHELSHIYLGHQRSRGQLNDLTRKAAMLTNVALNVESAFSGKQDMKAMIANQVALLVADDALFPAWSRAQEQAADALALDLMQRAGYSNLGATNVMEILQSEDEKRAAARAKAEAEAKQAQDEKIKQSLQSGKSDALSDALGNALKQGLASTLSDVKDTHGSAAGRADLVVAYLHREYPGLPTDAKEADWSRTLAQRDTARRLTSYRKIGEAVEMLLTQRPKEAAPVLRDATITELKGDPYLALAEFMELSANHRDEEGRRLLRQSIEREDAPMVNFTSLAQSEKSSKHLPEAIRVIETAKTRFQDPSALYPVAIAYYKEAGRASDVAQVQTRCQLTGDPGLTEQCKAAAK